MLNEWIFIHLYVDPKTKIFFVFYRDFNDGFEKIVCEDNIQGLEVSLKNHHNHVTTRAVDPDPYGFACILPPGSGSAH